MEELGINIVILTAGKGSRMKSAFPKICQKIAGRTMFEHVLASVNEIKKYNKNIIVVSSHEVMNKYVGELPQQENLKYTIQEDRLGTGDAVKIAIKSPYWDSKNNYTGIFYGDVPFVSQATMNKMFNLQNRFDLIVLGFDCKDQTRPYGRLFTDRDLTSGEYGELYKIKEFKDLMREKPRLCNSGLMIGKTEIFEKLLPLVKDNNKAKEYYLTDIIALANDHDYRVGTYICDEYEVIGINSRAELAHAEKEYQARLRQKHMDNGATLLDSDSVFFSYDTQIGQDVVIEPNVFFGLGVKIGNNCIVKAGCYLENTELKDNSNIGPYARTRGGVVIDSGVHIGNFNELKNTTIGYGTKIGHFGYIGDTSVGNDVNVGAGTVVCNYDGKNKHRTEIGSYCFVGSNSTLVAPLVVKSNSYIGGGSVITKKVNTGDLALGRAKQLNKRGWMKRKGLLKKNSE